MIIFGDLGLNFKVTEVIECKNGLFAPCDLNKVNSSTGEGAELIIFCRP